MKVGVETDPGLQRATNEDRVFVDEAFGIFLVVDGIGGHAAGDMAAETAVRVISERLQTDAKKRSSAPLRVSQAITAANNEIFELAQTREEWRGMACVLTLALIENGRVIVGHVGDSRLYLMSNGTLRKITHDHSPVGEREDYGEISEKEAMADPRRNQVFRDVGSRHREPSDRDFIEIHRFRFPTRAALLLCSDGLSDAVPSAEIATLIDSYNGDAESVSRRLVDAANTAGGKDNVSVVFVAGDDFAAAASIAARRRHSITRLRENRWRRALNRAIWLSGGVCMGTALWAFWDRALPESKAAPEAHRIVVSSSDPRLIAKTLSVAQPGDSLEVAPGEYLGPIELRDEINLISRKPAGAV
jgi:serine/threonine protein phosphatase PrpC